MLRIIKKRPEKLESWTLQVLSTQQGRLFAADCAANKRGIHRMHTIHAWTCPMPVVQTARFSVQVGCLAFGAVTAGLDLGHGADSQIHRLDSFVG